MAAHTSPALVVLVLRVVIFASCFSSSCAAGTTLSSPLPPTEGGSAGPSFDLEESVAKKALVDSTSGKCNLLQRKLGLKPFKPPKWFNKPGKKLEALKDKAVEGSKAIAGKFNNKIQSVKDRMGEEKEQEKQVEGEDKNPRQLKATADNSAENANDTDKPPANDSDAAQGSGGAHDNGPDWDAEFQAKIDAHHKHTCMMTDYCLLFAVVVPAGAYVWAVKQEPEITHVCVAWGTFIILVPGLLLQSYESIFHTESVKMIREYSLFTLMRDYWQSNLQVAALVTVLTVLAPVGNMALVCAFEFLRRRVAAGETNKQAIAQGLLWVLQYTCRLPLVLVFAFVLLRTGVAMHMESVHDAKVLDCLECGFAFFMPSCIAFAVMSITLQEVQRGSPGADSSSPQANDAPQPMSKQALLIILIFLGAVSVAGLAGGLYSGFIKAENQDMHVIDLAKKLQLSDLPMILGVLLIYVFVGLAFIANFSAMVYTALRLNSGAVEGAALGAKIARITSAVCMMDAFIVSLLVLDKTSDVTTTGFFWETFDMKINDGLFALLAAEASRMIASYLFTDVITKEKL